MKNKSKVGDYMAIKITENGKVRYVNENDVDRELFPNEPNTKEITENLNSILDSINNIIEVNAEDGFEGHCLYVKLGKIVVCCGTINGSGSVGDVALSGLPKPITSNAPIYTLDNNRGSIYSSLSLSANGEIKINVTNISNGSLRFMFSYITSE